MIFYPFPSPFPSYLAPVSVSVLIGFAIGLVVLSGLVGFGLFGVGLVGQLALLRSIQEAPPLWMTVWVSTVK